MHDLAPEVNTIVEGSERVDGPHHGDPAQRAVDRARDRALVAAGWRVVRAGEEDLDATAALVRTSVR